MRLSGILGISICAVVALACTSTVTEQETLEPLDTGEGAAADSIAYGAGWDEPKDTGNAAVAYPAGPYGTTEGAIIANVELVGWNNPTESKYDAENAERIQLSDFYDPDGEKGIKVILINSGAVWCPPCNGEYRGDFGPSLPAIFDELQPEGAMVLGTIFEDANNPPNPAKYVNMEAWAKRYKVPFPFAVDPSHKLGKYFSIDAVPMNMFVNARTMEILAVESGGDTNILRTELKKYIGQIK